MKTIYSFIVPVLLVLFLPGCIEDITIKGNGMQRTEQRATFGFDKVASEGDFDVYIESGDEFSVTVTAESNLLPYIGTDVNGNTLRIHVNGFHVIDNQLPMEILITMPGLRGLTQSGSGKIITEAFSAQDFKVVLSGSGTVETETDAVTIQAAISGSGVINLSGEANNGDFTISGTGKISAAQLHLNHCKATISGSGNMWVWTDRTINATISGSGNIYYNGEPVIDKKISGSGNLYPNL